MGKDASRIAEKLHRYMDRLYNTIYSRRDLEAVVDFDEYDMPLMGSIEGELYFWDGSVLDIREVVTLVAGELEKVSYSYNYRRADSVLIFRYDSAAHHPELSTFPHHKHIGDRVEPAAPPDLSDVLREIDAILYPSS
ncbi:MAG: toxin-antitoxin system TumE family protein [Anaerolineae bacterium]